MSEGPPPDDTLSVFFVFFDLSTAEFRLKAITQIYSLRLGQQLET